MTCGRAARRWIPTSREKCWKGNGRRPLGPGFGKHVARARPDLPRRAGPIDVAFGFRADRRNLEHRCQQLRIRRRYLDGEDRRTAAHVQHVAHPGEQRLARHGTGGGAAVCLHVGRDPLREFRRHFPRAPIPRQPSDAHALFLPGGAWPATVDGASRARGRNAGWDLHTLPRQGAAMSLPPAWPASVLPCSRRSPVPQAAPSARPTPADPPSAPQPEPPTTEPDSRRLGTGRFHRQPS